MKKLLVGLLALGSLSAFAGNLNCYVNNLEGKHFELDTVGTLNAIDTGVPFGIVTLHEVRGKYQVSSIIDGVETIFKVQNNKLSVTKQKPLGISENGNASIGNLVCSKF